MDIAKMKVFFKWCTIINGSLLAFSAVFCIVFQDLVYSIHSCLFDMPEQILNSLIYLFLGIMKILWIVFNVVPWAALILTEKNKK